MLSLPHCAAVCAFGLALSGCMQSMPTADISRPTIESFTRLNSWAPWSSPFESRPPVVVARQNPPPAAEAVEQLSTRPAVQRPAGPKPIVDPVRRLASPRSPSLPHISRTTSASAAATIPAVETGPALGTVSSSSLPAKVICQTTSQPGDRVRMECTPVE